MASGQSSAEYTALLALVAAALAGAGAVAGVGQVGAAVAGGVRTGICLVAGDVCRASDAAAAGLAPCTVAERTRGYGAELTIVSLRFGERGEWSVARRSDGSVVVTQTRSQSAGASGGFGLTASPLGVQLGVRGEAGFTLGSGRAWEFRDAAEAARFLAGVDRPPTWRFGDLGAELEADAGAGAGGAMLTGVEATAQAAAGVRVGRGATTLYVRAALAGPDLTVDLPGSRARRDGPGTGDLLVELTRAGGRLREIAFRRVERADGGRVVETVGRLDLRVAANRAAAEGLLARRLPWPPDVARDLRAVVRRTAQAGTVERAVYAVADGSRDFEAAGRLGLELGIDIDRVRHDRRLLAASAWTPGSGERERSDCLGVPPEVPLR